MNTKLHAVTPSHGLHANRSLRPCRAVDTSGRPIRFFITAGPLSAMQASPAGQRVSDHTGAAALMNTLPDADWLLADRGYDADWFRDAVLDRGTRPCIPGRKSRSKPIRYDKHRYRRRNKIERMFGRLKDWRRVATRYDPSCLMT